MRFPEQRVGAFDLQLLALGKDLHSLGDAARRYVDLDRTVRARLACKDELDIVEMTRQER